MITLTIKVTKDILEQTKYCGESVSSYVPSSCAISVAIRDIFPKALVYGSGELNFFGDPVNRGVFVMLPHNAQMFVQHFDYSGPEDRVAMNEFKFDIEVPDEAIERINIDEIKPLLENHPNLKLSFA